MTKKKKKIKKNKYEICYKPHHELNDGIHYQPHHNPTYQPHIHLPQVDYAGRPIGIWWTK